MLELYGITIIYFQIWFKDVQLNSIMHLTVLFFQTLTMITFPEKQVCYLARLSDNLPKPLQLLLAIKKVKINWKKGLEPGGLLPKKLGGGVRLASQTLTLAMTKICDFFLPYLWLGQKFDVLFMTVVAGTVALNIIYEGLWLMILSIMMKR